MSVVGADDREMVACGRVLDHVKAGFVHLQEAREAVRHGEPEAASSARSAAAEQLQLAMDEAFSGALDKLIWRHP